LVEVELRYGSGVHKVDVPSRNLVCVAKARKLPALAEFEAAISNVLDNPVGSEPLEKMVSSNSRIALIIDDITRPTPTNKILPIILERLGRKGVGKKKVCIVMATGAHDVPPLEKVKGKVGEQVLNSVEVHLHNCLKKEGLELVGFSSSGTPVWVNRKVLEADVKIGIGMIKPHTWAGFGGGAKIVLPGVSAWEAIGRNHFLAVSEDARIGNVDGNPVRRDAEEVASRIGLDFIINVVLDDNGHLVDVVAGDMVKAHRRGVDTVRKMFENRIEEVLDVMIWAFGPKDDNLWDVLTGHFIGAHKKLLKDRGTLILVAECKNGLYKYGHGHLDYSGKIADYSKVIEMLKSGMSPDELLSETIRGNMPYLEVGVKAYILANLARKKNVIMVSENIRREEVKWLGTTAKTVQEALSQALQTQGKDARIGIIPEFHASSAYIKI
jgi:nickel-dependent lactate racemase